MSDYLFIKDGNKNSHFIRTCTGRLYDITNCRNSILTDGHIDENDGLIPNAIRISDSYVVELMAKSESRAKRKASRIRKLQREEALN